MALRARSSLRHAVDLGLALIIEGLFRKYFGSSGLPYGMPERSRAGRISASCTCRTIGPGWSPPRCRLCFGTWFVIERTKLGAYLRAATENPTLVRAFGINVPRMITLTYGFGVGSRRARRRDGRADLPGQPEDGRDLIIVVFAVVVIGGMGSILGSIVTGFALGVIEGLTKVFYPEASSTVIFVIMAIVLLIRPAGLFGGEPDMAATSIRRRRARSVLPALRRSRFAFLVAVLLLARCRPSCSIRSSS